MSNHLEDLVAEWLEYSEFFVRKAVLVGRRAKGGFDGELDVVGYNPKSGHVIHVECSLDSDKWDRREERFTLKFERGRKYIPTLFHDLPEDYQLNQVALLGFGGSQRTELGGGRIVWVQDFIGDILDHLGHKSPAKEAVPSTLPLLRTMQLAAQRRKSRKCSNTLFGEC